MDSDIFDIDLSMSWTLLLCALITVFCILYLWELARSYKGKNPNGTMIHIDGLDGIEGFTGSSNSNSEIQQLVDDQCYDEFYAKVYDPLVQPTARAPMETKVALEWFAREENGSKSPNVLRIADIGCGAGLHVALFDQQGVKNVVGYDKSSAMIAEAKKRFPDLSANNSFVVGDATVPTMRPAGSLDLVTMYYFTVYMIPERTQMLRNIYLWLDMGGFFMVHIVNKHKFDTVLEAASPFVGFSIQKYADERITKSQVEFDKFSYTGDFNLHGSRATYEEVFTFKDGRVRRHEQRLWMPDIKAIVDEIESVGFKIRHHVDLVSLGYEYQYLMIFQKA